MAECSSILKIWMYAFFTSDNFKQLFPKHSHAIKGNVDGSTHTNWRLVCGWLNKDMDLS
jgi:hypothetical protein